jgi:predicted hydrocarbon binding protein
MEQVARAAGALMQVYMMDAGALSKAFYEKYGKEALPVITGVMSRGGEEMGKIMGQNLPEKNMNTIANNFRIMGPMFGGTIEVVESSDDSFRLKMARCPYGLEGAGREVCEAMMSGDEKMIGSALGLQVEMKILKSVAVGDKACEITFSMK